MKLLLSLDKNRIARAKKLETQQPLHVRFDFHGVKTQVCTNSSYLANHLRLGYSFFESTDNGEPHLSLLALEAGGPQYSESIGTLLPAREVGDHILVTRQLGLIFLLGNLPLFAYYTVKALFGQAVFLLHERFLGLHAAALAHEGCGLILCGAARCGKTILTTLLMDKGFRYFSDDVTLLARRSLKVVPFPRALTIRNEYESLLAPLLAQARRVQRFKIADQERLLVDLAHPVPEEVEPRVICLPRYELTRSAQLQPISPCKALVALMHHRFYPLVGSLEEYGDEDFEVLSRLLNRALCFELVYSDPVEAASILKNLILKEDAGK